MPATETIASEWNELCELVAAERAAHQAHVGDLREQLASEEESLLAHSIAQDALKGVPKDWKDPTAGTYVPAYFVSAYGRRVIPEELIATSDLQLSLVSSYEISSLGELDRARCPRCGGPAMLPVIEQYDDESTEDGGSDWLVPCAMCGAQEVSKP